MYAAHDDHIRLGASRTARKRQRIPLHVRHAMKDLGPLIVVSEHDRVAPTFEGVDLGHDVVTSIPFGGWHQPRDAAVAARMLVEVVGGAHADQPNSTDPRVS